MVRGSMLILKRLGQTSQAVDPSQRPSCGSIKAWQTCNPRCLFSQAIARNLLSGTASLLAKYLRARSAQPQKSCTSTCYPIPCTSGQLGLILPKALPLKCRTFAAVPCFMFNITGCKASPFYLRTCPKSRSSLQIIFGSVQGPCTASFEMKQMCKSSMIIRYA